MKNILIVLLASLLFGGCASGFVNFRKPDKVAVAFLKKVAHLDIEGMKALSSEENQAQINVLEAFLSNLSKVEKKALLEKNQAKIIALKKAICQISGNTAKCTVCCSETGQELPMKVELQKIDKKWLVVLKKEKLTKTKPNS